MVPEHCRLVRSTDMVERTDRLHAFSVSISSSKCARVKPVLPGSSRQEVRHICPYLFHPRHSVQWILRCKFLPLANRLANPQGLSQ